MRTEIRLEGRGLLTGKTRSGKTTLSRRILSPEKRCFIIDPKWCFKPLDTWGNKYGITDDPEKTGHILHNAHVIYRPDPEADWDVYNIALKSCWKTGIPHTLSVDEMSIVCPNPSVFPVILRAYWQQGGELGLKALGISQRPSGLPGFLFSESEQHWMFQLLLTRDRKRASEWIGDEAIGGTSRLHSFWYRHVNNARPKEFELELTTSLGG